MANLHPDHTVRRVTKYEAADGKLFDNPDDAAAHSYTHQLEQRMYGFFRATNGYNHTHKQEGIAFAVDAIASNPDGFKGLF